MLFHHQYVVVKSFFEDSPLEFEFTKKQNFPQFKFLVTYEVFKILNLDTLKDRNTKVHHNVIIQLLGLHFNENTKEKPQVQTTNENNIKRISMYHQKKTNRVLETKTLPCGTILQKWHPTTQPWGIFELPSKPFKIGD